MADPEQKEEQPESETEEESSKESDDEQQTQQKTNEDIGNNEQEKSLVKRKNTEEFLLTTLPSNIPLPGDRVKQQESNTSQTDVVSKMLNENDLKPLATTIELKEKQIEVKGLVPIPTLGVDNVQCVVKEILYHILELSRQLRIAEIEIGMYDDKEPSLMSVIQHVLKSGDKVAEDTLTGIQSLIDFAKHLEVKEKVDIINSVISSLDSVMGKLQQLRLNLMILVKSLTKYDTNVWVSAYRRVITDQQSIEEMWKLMRSVQKQYTQSNL